MKMSHQAMELGAAMLYGGNLYMEQLTKLMGLTVKTYGHDPASTHIYNGQRVVLQLVRASDVLLGTLHPLHACGISAACLKP